MTLHTTWLRCMRASVVLVLAACGGGDATEPDVPPVITVTSASGPSVVSGSTLQLTANAKDRKGKAVQNPTVSWVSQAPTVASVSASGLVTGAVAGPATISATYDGVSASFSITVVPGAPARLALRTQPSGAASGVALTAQPAVEVRDAAENVVTSSSVSVTAAIASGGGALLGVAIANAQQGVVAYGDLTIIGTVGSRTLSFSAPGLTGVTSAPFTLNAGAASRLVVRTQPTGAQSGAPFLTQPVVEVRDGADNVVPTSTAPITAAISSGGGTITGTTQVPATAGVATFTNVRLDGVVGDRTLIFSSPGLTAAISSTFALQPGAATSLAIRIAPAGAGLNGAFTTQPVIELRDGAGNIATTSAGVVAATITTGTGTLTGASANATNGVATFASLGISGSPGSRVLRFASGSLTPASFTITPCDGTRNPEVELGATSRSLIGFSPVMVLDTVAITDKVASCQPIAGLATSIAFGGATGWLSASFLQSPARLVLRADPAAVVVGTYAATVTVSTANAGTAALSVSFQVRPTATVTFGADNQKVLQLDPLATITIPAVVRSDGVVVVAPVQYTSRSTTIATIANDGTITARATGQTWLVASTTRDGGAIDSVYLNVTRATGPLLRADITRFTYVRGNDFSVSLFLDTRGTTIGAATVIFNWPTVNGTPGLIRSNTTVAGPVGNPVITSDAGSGTTRISIASATGMTGVIFLGRVDFTAVTAGTSLLALRFSDLVDLSQQSLLGTAHALQYPMVIR
jgi:hypothetical protein